MLFCLVQISKCKSVQAKNMEVLLSLVCQGGCELRLERKQLYRFSSSRFHFLSLLLSWQPLPITLKKITDAKDQHQFPPPQETKSRYPKKNIRKRKPIKGFHSCTPITL
uniref:Uncharacterized protein n=1 Tax=Opuntia streptacantha TaxID=393608 RepID=A0A7C9CXL1_OPUST